ncbi:MAG: 4-hydroxy-tetrahydrodipicolinate reductase [Candidatus Omnitrophica bacterium]|nr:4-hydroxy-tetrahydrodipicolinate reductase [Candidatus Omnitrophota bacterium]
MAVKLVISGACGRMGQAIARCALGDAVFSLGAVLEASGHEAIGKAYSQVLGRPVTPMVTVSTDAKQAMGQGDVVIEFTSPEATIAHLALAQELRKPMVIGTTGLSEAQLVSIRNASKAIPIMFSPNMSVGVNVLFELAHLAAQRLGLSYDVEVVEAHHKQKKDAPSGTAKRLAEELAAARQQPTSAITVHAVRAGDIVGDHTVILAGPSERLELTHRAHSRDVFAQGALRAAQFVVKQQPGLYDMSHVLKSRVTQDT